MKSTQYAIPNTQYDKRIDWKNYALFSIAVVIFAYIITRDVTLPKEVLLPIAGLGLMTLVFASFKNPQFSLLLLIAYLPFSKQLVGQFGAGIVGLNLSNILLIIVIFGWIVHSLIYGEKIFSKNWLNPIILLFCLWGFFTLIRARLMYGEYYALEDFFILFKRWITPIFLYFIGLNMVKDKPTFKKVVFVIMLATLIVALMAVRDYMHYGDQGSMEESRIGGVFEQPNMLGAFLVYNMFFFLTFLLYYWRSFKYWLLLIPFVVCFRGIMVTFSRGAYMAFAFGAVMTSFFRSKILFVIVLFLTACAVLSPLYLPAGIRNRMAATFNGGQVISTDLEEIKDPSATSRLLIWKGAIEMIKAQPLFGFGYGTFPYVIGGYVPEAPDMDAHNTYLILAAEMGIPSLAIFLVILLTLIIHAWWLLLKTKDRYFKAFALGMLGGIFGLLVANMFGSRLNSEEVSSYFWILSGLLMRAVIMRRQEISSGYSSGGRGQGTGYRKNE